MHVIMNTGVFFDGQLLAPGATYTVPDYFGVQLIEQGRARQTSAPAPASASNPASLTPNAGGASVAEVAPAPARIISRRG